MKLLHKLHVFSLLVILPCASSSAKFSLISLKNQFFPKQLEAKIETSYQLDPGGTIELKNINGNIDIYSNEAQEKITVHTTKCAPEEELALIHTSTHLDNNTLSIETVYDKPIKKSIVHYKIGLPSTTSTNLCITNKKGKIKINDCTGTITTKNGHGNTLITNATNTVDAKNLKRGTIFIEKPSGHVKVSTNQGTIKINQSKNSVIAHARNGKIELHAAVIPDGTKIKLKNNRGNIVLTLPEDVHAKVRASTTRGNVTCQHAVTLEPNTTELNPTTWEKFKQSIQGTIGDGKSQIVVHSEKSNITINKDTKKKA